MVLVTGGVRGVGAGISEVFAGQGATVITCARRPVEGSPYEFHSCDIRDDAAVQGLIDTIVATHGRLDVVVNNAGGSPYVPAADASAKFNTKIIELNLIGALSVSTHANAVMQKQETGGTIVNISSVLGITTAGLPQAAYSASKAAIAGLTRDLAQQWGTRKGIRVNAIAPGFFQSEMTDQYKPGYLESVIERSVLGRTGDPAELAATLVWLASPAGGYVTGQTIVVDGGVSIT